MVDHSQRGFSAGGQIDVPAHRLNPRAAAIRRVTNVAGFGWTTPWDALPWSELCKTGGAAGPADTYSHGRDPAAEIIAVTADALPRYP